MAPARMVSFMKKHAKSCEVCLQDADLKEEIAKITEIVLPESKIPKAIRQKNEQNAQKEEELEAEQKKEDNKEDIELDENSDGDDNKIDEEVDENLDLDDDPKLLSP